MGTQRLEFAVPEELAGSNDAMQLEFRVRIVGLVPLVIRSVRTRQLLREVEAFSAPMC
jgi:hypothetical protein